jgi:hypothetical protein
LLALFSADVTSTIDGENLHLPCCPAAAFALNQLVLDNEVDIIHSELAKFITNVHFKYFSPADTAFSEANY